MPLYIVNLLVYSCILPIPILIFHLLLVLFLSICNTLKIHSKEAKRIVHFGIHYSTRENPLLVNFTDFDWDGDPHDRKSTTCYIITLGSGHVTWACKKLSSLALSSIEVEYRASVQANKEVMWL